MKKLINILENVVILQKVNFNEEILINNIAFDSREVQQYDVFVATIGVNVDGHNYIEKAIENGAKVIVCSNKSYFNQNEKVCYILVENTTSALALLAKNYYDNPSSKLKLIGVTGTNGKTTTVTLLYNLFSLFDEKVGLISTVKYCVGNKEYPSTHTTPNVLKMNQLLAEMVEANCAYVFMEVSSHAIHQKRIEGLQFEGGIFTNISHDHLDYHKTFKEYINTKKAFFDSLSTQAFALTNIDDKNGEVMMQNTKATVYHYSLKALAHFKAKILSHSIEGMELAFNNDKFFTQIVGVYNCYNLLVTYAVAILLKKDKDITLNSLSVVKGAKGRFETILDPHTSKLAVVDYAHTDDALKNLLEAVNKVRTNKQKIITVIGCGGDRDKAKRPLMAKVALLNSDYVVLTSDNPRTENPNSILDDMWIGVAEMNNGNIERLTDRKEAIKKAIELASERDIVVVAGKGHEDYQEINGVKYPFDDSKIIKEIFNLN